MTTTLSPIQREATATAHELAARLARLAESFLDGEIIGTACLEPLGANLSGLRITVSIAPAGHADAMNGHTNGYHVPPTMPKVRDIEKAILDATPTDYPVSLKKLASVTGYKLNWYFRDAVRRLIDAGTIFRVTGGVRRARPIQTERPVVAPSAPSTTTNPVSPIVTVQKLPPLHAKIVSVLDTGTPRKAEWIAAKLHRACSGSFRSALSDMVSFGILKKGDGGYFLA